MRREQRTNPEDFHVILKSGDQQASFATFHNLPLLPCFIYEGTRKEQGTLSVSETEAVFSSLMLSYLFFPPNYNLFEGYVFENYVLSLFSSEYQKETGMNLAFPKNYITH